MEAPNIEKIKAGDEAALKDLFTALLPRIRYMVSKYSARFESSPDVDDIVEETIFKIYSNLQKFDSGPEKFWPWCYAIARNVAIEALRTERRRSGSIQYLADTFTEEVPTAQPRAIDSSVDTAILLNETLQLLSEDERTFFKLLYEGFTAEEIAQRFEITPSAVLKRTSRLHGKLKRLLLTHREGSTKEVAK